MNRSALSFFIFIFLLGPFFQSDTFAQPFPCDNGQRLYFFRNNGGNGTLSYIQNYTTTPSVVNLCNMPTATHNGLAGNPLDGFLYYTNGNVLMRLSSNCTATPVCNLTYTGPAGGQLGGFDPLGRYWTYDGTSLIAIDINTCSVVKGPYPVTLSNIIDLAFNPYDCNIYIGSQRFDTTGTVDPTYVGPNLSAFGGTGFVGAAVGSNGNIYTIAAPGFFSSSSPLVTFNPNTGIATQVMTINPGSPATGGGDMANFPCFEMDAQFRFTLSGCQPVTVNFQDSTSGPTGTWTYQWNFGDPGSGAANTASGPNPTHTYANPGTYTIQLIANLTTTGYCLGGSYTDTLVRTITIPNPMITNAPVITPVSCNGGSNGSVSITQIGGTGPYTYQWSPSGGTSASASGLTAGTYTVTVTDANGCSRTVPVNVPQPTLLQPGNLSSPFVTNNVACSGGNNGTASIIMTGATPAYTYQWSSGTPNGNSVSGLSAGVYSVTVSDANGCTYTNSFNISEPPPLAVNLSPPAPICAGESASLNVTVLGGSGPYQYLWSNGSTSAGLTVTPAATTTYTVSITDANGCVHAPGQTVTVNVLSNAVPIAYPAVSLCPGQTAVLTAPAGMNNYTWSGTGGAAGTQDSLAITLPPGSSGAYSVAFTTGNGCTGTATYEVNAISFNLAPLPGAAVCAGSSTTLNAPPGLSSYSWSPTAGLNTNGIANPQVSPAGTTTYTLVATDSNGCADSTTATVTVNSLVLSATSSASVCNGYSATLSATPGLAGYAWTPSAGLSASNIPNPIASPTASTTYMLVATDANGCTDTTYSTVTVNGLTITASADQQICLGGSVGLSSTSGLVAYNWSPSIGLNSSTIVNPVATPTGTTTYTVIATDANGCTGTATTTVTVNSLTLAPIPNTAICEGSTSTLQGPPGLASYAWTPASGLLTNGIANPQVSPAGTTTYTLMATDANGCVDTTTTTVVVNSLQLASPGNPFICIGSSASIGTTSGLVNYSWSPAAGLNSSSIANPVANPTSTTTYTVIATDANGCRDTTTSTVTVGNPTVQANAPLAICLGDAATLSATPGFLSYSWSPAAGLSASNVANPSASPTTTTTYTVTATANGGCTATASTTVTVNQLTLSPIPGSSVCLGSSTTLQADPGLASYSWFPSSGLNSNNAANPIASPTTTTTYTLTATDANGCVDTTTTTVVVNSLQLASPGNPFICIGSSASIGTTSGLVNYSWSPAAGLSSSSIANPVANPTSTTTYTVIATDTNGCRDTTTSTVTVGNPTVQANAPLAVCLGDAATLSATPGFMSYSWSPAAGLNASNVANPSASPTTTTTYTVTATANGGCTATASTTVNINQLTLSAIPSSSVCLGSSTTLQADPGLASYSWFPSSGLNSAAIANPSASPSSTTTYTLVASDANGCVDSITTTVTVNSLSLASPGNPFICIGSSTSLNTTPGLVLYNWTPTSGLSATNIANPVANPTSTTTYTLVATDANGCSDAITATVTVGNPTVQANAPLAVCLGDAATLSATPGFMSYSWSPAAGLSASNVANPSASPTTTTTYTVTATANGGCTATASTTVTVNQLTLSPIPGSSVCLGSSTSLQADPGLASYSWSPSSGLNSNNGANPVASPTTTTTYTLTATDANGCVDTTASTITVNSLALPPVPNSSICLGESTSLNALPGLTHYSWTPSAGLSSPAISNPSASPQNTTTYTLVATDANGCMDTISTTVIVNRLIISASADTSICIDGTAILSTTPGLVSYSWTPLAGLNSGIGSTVSANPDSSTEYTVTATDLNGCTDNATVRVTVNTLNLFAAPDTGICPGEKVQLRSTPGLVSYAWSPSTGLSSTTVSSPIASPLQTQNYTVIATDTNGCSNSKKVTLTVYDQPRADFDYTPTEPSLYLPQVSFVDISVGADSWWWTFGDGSSSQTQHPVHAYDSAGTYPILLVVANSNGCMDSIVKPLRIKSTFAFWIPNAFSPNNDGINEIYKGEAFNIQFDELMVFNRFGELLFTSRRLEDGWDGSYLGSPAEEGTYVCLVRYRDPENTPYEMSKHFSLVR